MAAVMALMMLFPLTFMGHHHNMGAQDISEMPICVSAPAAK
jgi:hypothetical protein